MKDDRYFDKKGLDLGLWRPKTKEKAILQKPLKKIY